MNIDALDKFLIKAWHQGWHPEWLDQIVPWWREKETWIFLYVLLIAWLIFKNKWKGLATAALGGCCVGLADYTSAGIIKPLAGRLRPCNTPELSEYLDLLTGCGPGLSFPSAHAANHFALATFLAFTCFRAKPIPKWLFWVWAASIALGQVYVGRHYFSDIIAGGLLGFAIGWLVAYLSNSRLLPNLKW